MACTPQTLVTRGTQKGGYGTAAVTRNVQRMLHYPVGAGRAIYWQIAAGTVNNHAALPATVASSGGPVTRADAQGSCSVKTRAGAQQQEEHRWQSRRCARVIVTTAGLPLSTLQLCGKTDSRENGSKAGPAVSHLAHATLFLRLGRAGILVRHRAAR